MVCAGLIGLFLSYALTLTSTHIILTRWYCSLSNYRISVERIKQFMDIPSESPVILEGRRRPSSWPSRGRIRLQALKIRKLISENIRHRGCSLMVLRSDLVLQPRVINSNVMIASFVWYQIKYRPAASLVLKGLTCTFK